MTLPGELLTIGNMEITDEKLFKDTCQKYFEIYIALINNKSKRAKKRMTKINEALKDSGIELKDVLEKIAFYLIYSLTLFFDCHVPKVTFSDVCDFLRLHSDDNKFYIEFLKFVIADSNAMTILKEDIAGRSDVTTSLSILLPFFERSDDMKLYITKLIERKKNEPFKRVDQLLEMFDFIFSSDEIRRTWSFKSLFDDENEKEEDAKGLTNPQNNISSIDLSIFDTIVADAWNDEPSFIDEDMKKMTFTVNRRKVDAEFIHNTSKEIMESFIEFNQKPIVQEFLYQMHQKNIAVATKNECYVLGLIFTIYCLYFQNDDQPIDVTSIYHLLSDRELRVFVTHVFTKFKPLKYIRKTLSIKDRVNKLTEKLDNDLFNLIRQAYERMRSDDAFINIYGNLFKVYAINNVLRNISNAIYKHLENDKFKARISEINSLYGFDINDGDEYRIIAIFLLVCCINISTSSDSTFNRVKYSEIREVVTKSAEALIQCIRIIYENYRDVFIRLKEEEMSIDMQITVVMRTNIAPIVEIIRKIKNEAKARSPSSTPKMLPPSHPQVQERKPVSKKKDRAQQKQKQEPIQTSQAPDAKPPPKQKQKQEPKQKPAPKQNPAPKPTSQASVQDKPPAISKSKLKQKNIRILQRLINLDAFQHQTQDMASAIQDLRGNFDPNDKFISDSNDCINIAFIIYANCINFVDVKKRYFEKMNVNEVFASVIEDKYALFKCVDYIHRAMQDSCNKLKFHSDFIKKIQLLNESFLDKTLLTLILPAFNSKRREFPVPKSEILNTSVKIGNRNFTYNFLCNASMEIAICLHTFYIDMESVAKLTVSIESKQKIDIDKPDERFFISLFIIIACLHNSDVEGNYDFLINIIDNMTEGEIYQLLKLIYHRLHESLNGMREYPFEKQINAMLRLINGRSISALSRPIADTKSQHDFIESIAKLSSKDNLNMQNEEITSSFIRAFNSLDSDIKTSIKDKFRISVTSKPTCQTFGFILTISIAYVKRILEKRESEFDIFEKLIKDKIVNYVTEIYTHIPPLMKKLEKGSDFESLIKIFIKEPSFFVASMVCRDLKAVVALPVTTTPHA